VNIDEFNTLVSTSLRRGNSLDSFIPLQTALAVQFMERNYNFKYMEMFRLINIQGPQGAIPGQRVILMPSGVSIKAWILFRIINSDGSYSYIDKVEPKDLTMVDSSANTFTAGSVPAPNTATIKPRNFFQVGLSTVVLDAVPSQNYSAEAMFYGYSSWPTDPTTVPSGGSDFTHPLLQTMSDVLLAQTQWNMAKNVMKDTRMIQVYEADAKKAFDTLLRAEDELKYSAENMRMLYKPAYDEQQSLNVTR